MGNCYKKTLKKINLCAKELKNIATEVDDLIPDNLEESNENKKEVDKNKKKENINNITVNKTNDT